MDFLAKKLVGGLLMPLPIALVLIALGLFWLRKSPQERRGWVLAVCGFALLYLASTAQVAWLLLYPLEAGQDGYQPHGEVAAIVVLGAGYHPVEKRPLTGQISGASTVRVAEAVRIAKLHPHAMLHCSGYGGRWDGSNAAAACQLAVELGVEATRVVVHAQPRDTAEEAATISAAVGDRPLVVVTHAAHMSRAMTLFRRHHGQLQSAPTGHVSRETPNWSPLPNAFALGTTSAALHEWLGRLWAEITG